MFSAALLVVALQVVSPELLVAPPAPGFGAGQYLPAVAFDGTQHLVAWHDHRAGEEGSAWAAVVTPAGARVGDDFDLLPARGHKLVGDAEFDGVNFVVAMSVHDGVVLQRVTPAGRPLDPAGIQVSSPDCLDGLPRLATDGSMTVVVWAENRWPQTDIRAARVGRDGVVRDLGGVTLRTSMTTQVHQPDIAFDGTDFVVTWREAPRSLFVARLSPTLAVQAPGPQLVYTAPSGELLSPRVDCTAGTPVLSYVQGLDGDRLRPFVIRGQPAATPVQLATDYTSWLPVDLHFDGTNYLAFWVQRDDATLRGARLTSALVPSDPGGLVLANEAGGGESGSSLALDRNGAGLLAWPHAGRHQVFTGRLTPASLTLTGPAPVSATGGSQHLVALAARGGRRVLAWVTPRFPNGLLLQLGTSAASGAWTVTDASSGEDKAEWPAVAMSDTEALLAWSVEGTIYARRFALDGTPLDAQRLVVCANPSAWSFSPAVAFDGTNFVIGFQQDGVPLRVRAAVVPRTGPLVQACGQQLALSVPDAENYPLRGAGGPGTVAFAWELLDTQSWQRSIRVVRAQGSTALDATPLIFAPWTGTQPSLSWNGADFVLAWADGRRWLHDLRLARLPPTGAPRDADGLVVSALDVDQRRPEVAFDGSRYLLVWEDERRGQFDLRGAYVAADLSPSTDDFAVADSAELEQRARVVTEGAGRFLVSYERFDRSPGVVARRAAVRELVVLEQGSACTADRECPSGFCVDGVCCDAACGGGAEDCQACSVAKGAAAEGKCTVLPAQTVCRAAVSECDVAESCDGAATTCGPDRVAPDGLACQAGAGVCAAGACRTDASPRFTSPVTVTLTCGQTWSYSKSGRPTVAGEGPFSFSARSASGEPLPAGFSLDAATGELRWETTRDSPGTLVVELRVESPAGSDTQLVHLEVECERRQQQVGCAAVPGAWVALAALALRARRRRR